MPQPTPLSPNSVNLRIRVSSDDSLVLDASWGNVVAWPLDGGNNQLWIFNSDGTITSQSGLLLTIAPTTGLLSMAAATSTLAYQRWQRSGLYIVANLPAGTNVAGLTPPLVIDVRGENMNRKGNLMGVWRVNTPPTSNQQFSFSVFSQRSLTFSVKIFAKRSMPLLTKGAPVCSACIVLCNPAEHSTLMYLYVYMCECMCIFFR